MKASARSKSTFQRLLRFPRMLGRAFVLECVKTKRMTQTFLRQGWGQLHTARPKPSVEEWQQAVAQLRAMPRFLPFFVLLALPVPGVTEGYVLLAILVEKSLGQRVQLLPDPFREVFQSNPRLAA